MTEQNHIDDVLDRLAAEIRAEALDDDAVATAADRIWSKIEREHSTEPPLRSCDDVRAALPAFAAGELGEARSLLIGDHTRACVPCRRALLELRGRGGDAQAGSVETRSRRIPPWLSLAATALIVLGGGFVAYIVAADLLADRSFSGRVVAAAAGQVQLVTEDGVSNLAAGAAVHTRQRIRTAKSAGAFLELADGSVVEMAPRSELRLRANRHGGTIELARGDIIVHAADQGRGRLAVITSDCEVAVKGTIFAVNHGLKGSRVSVIEGAVEVRQGSTHALLEPGDQLTTDARIDPVAIEEEIAWSADADAHRALLTELTSLHRDITDTIDAAVPRTSTRLLDLAPPDTVIYIALPDLTDGLNAARNIVSSRVAESDILSDWWQREIVDRGIDVEIEDILDRIQFLGDAIGDEIVVALDAGGFAGDPSPLILAEAVDAAALRALLAEHLTGQPPGSMAVAILDDPADPIDDNAELLIWIADDLVVAARSATSIRHAAERITGRTTDTFVGAPLHDRLAERYADGVEWLVGVDVERAIAAMTADAAADDLATMRRIGLMDATTLVAERHRINTGAEIGAELRFNGSRSGIAAWLAAPAPLATLDFVSADAVLAVSIAATDGAELFDELLDIAAAQGPDALAELHGIEADLGIDLRADLAATLGGEGTFAIDGPVLPEPTWLLVVEVYDPQTLEHTIDRVITRINSELAGDGFEPVSAVRSESGGLRFVTLSHPSSPVDLTYTTADGVFVAASNPAAIERALRVRASATGLTRSAVFRGLLPDNGFTDCSALVWRNLEPIADIVPAAGMGSGVDGYTDLLAESAAPGMVCVYGLDDRILVSATGPTMSALAPLLGLHGMMVGQQIGGTIETADGAEGLSSPS